MKTRAVLLLLVVLTLVGVWFVLINPRRVVAPEGEVGSAPKEVVPAKTESDTPVATLVPHHDLVKDKRAEVLKDAGKVIQPETVVLLSPNHFNAGHGDFLTTSRTWELSTGQIAPDSASIGALTEAGLVTEDEAAVRGDHGITNLLGDLKTSFPQAELVPILLRQDAAREKTEQLADALAKNCTSPSRLLIASVDFSHYQPAALANLHDRLSERALITADEDIAWRSEVDSPQSLLTLIRFAKAQNASKFTLKYHTNSGQIANSRDAETTSHIMGWYTAGTTAEPEPEVTFLIGGDMMFDRSVDAQFRGNKLQDVMADFGERVFWGTDLSLVNLEGPISSEPIPVDTRSNNLIFNFPPQTPDILSYLHINAVSLANNHSGNAGASGLVATRKLLTAKNVAAIGAQTKIDETSVARFKGSGMELSAITINTLETKTDITAQIKVEKARGNAVLVFPHWGNEYAPKHSAAQASLAHVWIEAGADIIIGSHPHVIQDAELYHSRPVIYSLGNLLFDQWFSKETQRGLLIGGRFTKDRLELVILHTESRNLKPRLLTGVEKTERVNQIRKDLNQPLADELGSDTIVLERKG